jgi:hypothetical protein
MDSTLNGWQRLFALLFALSLLALIGVMASVKPKRSDTGTYYVDACGLSVSRWDVSPAGALFYLKNGTIPAEDMGYAADGRDGSITPKCREQLAQIANGTRYRALLWNWVKVAGESFCYLLGSAWMVYLLGTAIGWVWRGFFPRKPAA